MGLNDLVAKVTDPYERQARLYPALLALFPLIAMLELLYAPKISVLTNVLVLAGSCGGLYLLTNVCRDLGKRVEPKLYEVWGGKPTTQLLRHRDNTIEKVTKRRYHAFLANKINEPFPDKEQEATNQSAADDLYQSAVRWLLNQTRDTQKFGLLFRENITYGFRRNALGVKPIGVLISIGSLIWVILSQGVLATSMPYYIDFNSLKALTDMAVISLIISGAMLLVWVLVFTRAFVRNTAFTYAEMLLRACDALNK
jgi:hypothetical protein